MKYRLYIYIYQSNIDLCSQKQKLKYDMSCEYLKLWEMLKYICDMQLQPTHPESRSRPEFWRDASCETMTCVANNTHAPALTVFTKRLNTHAQQEMGGFLCHNFSKITRSHFQWPSSYDQQTAWRIQWQVTRVNEVCNESPYLSVCFARHGHSVPRSDICWPVLCIKL